MSGKLGKREYSIEFKIDAARLVVDQGYTVKDACERLGVPLSNMSRWLRQYRKGKLQPGHKQAQPTANETEVKRLQSEVKRLEMEVAILKKASAYFARQMT
jgi:transposase